MNKLTQFIKNLFNKKSTDEQPEALVVETSVEEKSVVEAAPVVGPSIEPEEISEEEKAAILDILRPVVKELNASTVYDEFCKYTGIEKKALRTFGAFTDEGHNFINVKLSQSAAYGEKICDFVCSTARDAFDKAIQNNYAENGSCKYEVFVYDNCVLIKKK